MLALIVVAAVGLGWLAHKHRAAGRRATSIAELARSGTFSCLDEPTVVAQVVKKLATGREAWLRKRLSWGWYDHPRIFNCSDLTDNQVPKIAARLQELGHFVRSITTRPA